MRNRQNKETIQTVKSALECLSIQIMDNELFQIEL